MVRLTLAEKGVAYRTHRVDIGKTANQQFEPWYVALNPKAVVPTLAIGDRIITNRVAGNTRFQAALADPDSVAEHIAGAHDLVRRLDDHLATSGFVAGDCYSLADTFATAALARFDMHGFAGWWSKALPAVAAYYARVAIRPSWKAAGIINTA